MNNSTLYLLRDYIMNRPLLSVSDITKIIINLESLLMAALDSKHDNEYTIIQILQCYYFLLRENHSMCLVEMLQENDFSKLYNHISQYSEQLFFPFSPKPMLWIVEKHKHDILAHLVATLTDLVHHKNIQISILSICLLSWIGSTLEIDISISWTPGVFSCFGRIIRNFQKAHLSFKLLFIECFSIWLETCFSENAIKKIKCIDSYRKRISPMLESLSGFAISSLNDHLSRIVLGNKLIAWIQNIPTFLSSDNQLSFIFSILIMLLERFENVSNQCLEESGTLSEPFHKLVTKDLLSSSLKFCKETIEENFIQYIQVIISSCIYTNNVGKEFFHDHFSDILEILKDRIHLQMNNDTKLIESKFKNYHTKDVLFMFAQCSRIIMDESIMKLFGTFVNSVVFHIGTLYFEHDHIGSEIENQRMMWNIIQETLDASSALYKMDLDNDSENMAILWSYRISLLYKNHPEIFSTILIKILPTILILYSCSNIEIQDMIYHLLCCIKSEKTISLFLLEHHTYLLHDIQMNFYTESNIEQAGLVLCSFVKLLKCKDNSHMIYEILGNVFLNKILETLEANCNRRGNKKVVMLLFYVIMECVKELLVIDDHDYTVIHEDMLDQILHEYTNNNDSTFTDNIVDNDENVTLPDPYPWMIRMMKSISYFLADDNAYTRLIALRILKIALECTRNRFPLNTYRIHIFPLVSSLWPMFIQVFKHSYAISSISLSYVIFYSCLDVLQEICKCCGSFIQNRISDIYDDLTRYLENYRIETEFLDLSVVVSTQKFINDMNLIPKNLVTRSMSDHTMHTMNIILNVIGNASWPKRLWKALIHSTYSGLAFENLLKTIIIKWTDQVLCDLMYHYSNICTESPFDGYKNETHNLSKKFISTLKMILYNKENTNGIMICNGIDIFIE